MTVGIVCLVAAAMAFVVANVVKIIVRLAKGHSVKQGLMSSGGMPSVHSACVAALATVIGISEGLDSVGFALALVFLIVVVYDATHVRRAVGEQGEALSGVLAKGKKRPYSSAGHKPEEAIVGCALGILVGYLLSFLLYL